MKKFLKTGLLAVILIPCPGWAQPPGQDKTVHELLIPVGMDAYRNWDHWPLQRIGVRSYMRSTYDRSGGNESADASHFLFANEEDKNVTLDVKGKGVLYFFRANHWHGSPWHFVVDSMDHIVQETATSDPVHALKIFKHTEFIPSDAFPEPLNWTWTVTKGADLICEPIPFEERLQIAYSLTHYGTGYWIYHLFANEDMLSQPVRSWKINQKPDQDVLDLISRSGTDIAPKNIQTKKGRLSLNKETVLLAVIDTPVSVVRAFKLTIPMEKTRELERMHIKITWDDAAEPSVDAPLCLFFGAGTLYNRDNREYLVKAFPVNIRYDYTDQKIELSCYYPMPFFRSARFELTGINPEEADIEYEIRFEPLSYPVNRSSYFHATYTDIPVPEPGKDMVFLDTEGAEGKKEWSGSFAGTSFVFSHDGFLGTLEGDPRFFFDDARTPQAYGTGTEEWGGGGDYWGGENMTLPFAGHPCGCPGKNQAKNERDLIESGYRFLLADLMPFGRRALIRFEHGGENLSVEHYEAVTYWYGLPAPSLIKTDSVDIGNLASEMAHEYKSPGASSVQTISSRYEWGIDTFPGQTPDSAEVKLSGNQIPGGKVIYPESKKDGRFTRGSSEFTVKIRPDNCGAMLRRTLDYSFPNQTAVVYVDDSGIGEENHWKKAGIWYLAGSNTCLYSNPPGETDKRSFTVETSNRRFRDDEFLIPSHLTRGKSVLKIRIVFVPDHQRLSPDDQFPGQNAWSELDYDVYSYVVPDFRLNRK